MLGEILREGWFYQEILQEGREKGLKEGRQEGELQGLEKGLQTGLEKGLKQGELQGLQKGELQGLRQSLTSFVEARFPELVVLAQLCADRINDPNQLQRLLLSLFALQTSEQVQEYLLKTLKRNEH